MFLIIVFSQISDQHFYTGLPPTGPTADTSLLCSSPAVGGEAWRPFGLSALQEQDEDNTTTEQAVALSGKSSRPSAR